MSTFTGWADPVSQDEFHAIMNTFHDRSVSRTDICEPPVEQYHDASGTLIGCIWLNDAMRGHPAIKDESELRRVYCIAKGVEAKL